MQILRIIIDDIEYLVPKPVFDLMAAIIREKDIYKAMAYKAKPGELVN